MERSGTVDKAVRVLEALHRALEPLSLAELAARVDMPKPTLHRLLASLLAHDLVEQDGEARYGLGVGLVRLGLGALSVDPFVRVARAELERAARSFGETFFLVGARAGRLVVLDKVEGTGLLRAAPSVGTEVPVEVTASGRLYLGLEPAALRESERPSVSAQAPSPEGGTLRPSRMARSAVQQAAARGYDLNRSEWIAGLAVVAAPVSANGRLYGTVACAAADAQLDEARLAEAIRQTCAVAERVSRLLDGRSSEARGAARDEHEEAS
jgi:IclR family acetate operon transcriptional repressor